MASSSPPRPREDAVCCMCGDHGLPGELFRCRVCRARLQHRYCSDLYPRAAAYRRCNWCLRQQPVHKHAESETKRKATSAASVEEERPQPEGCSRRPPAEVVRPVKKHKADEKMPPPPPAGTAKWSDTGDAAKKVMRAGGKAPARANRVKVQRYRLLAEVISC